MAGRRRGSGARSLPRRRPLTSGRREWARAIHGDYDTDGLWYPSSMSGTVRRAGDPRHHGHAVALFGPARSALPAHPVLNLPLSHPALRAAIARVADRFGYSLLP